MERLFQITRLGCTEVEKISLKDNGPHVHDFEELLIGDNMAYKNQTGLGK